MRKLIGTMLNELNAADFDTVSNGEEALALFQEKQLDLLILDNKMSPVVGVELTRMVRAGETPLPLETLVIMVYGALEHDLIAAARDWGINEFLAKPVSTQMIAQRYRTIIEKPKAFVKTEKFYGPDRRRQMRPPVWTSAGSSTTTATAWFPTR